MSYPTFLIVCGVIIAIPFIISCTKGIPIFGLGAGVVSVAVMAFVATHGGSMFAVHLFGFFVAMIATVRLLSEH